MRITPKEKELVAVGISVATGCKPCTDHHVTVARKARATDEEIRQAASDAFAKRRSAADIMQSHAGNKLSILTFTSLYPNSAQPCHGIFTEHRLRSLLATDLVDTQVIAPVPWVPGFMRRSSRYGPYGRAPKCDRRNGIDIVYPRYPVVPKVGMTIAPFLMAAAMFGLVRKFARGARNFEILDAFYFYPDGVAAVLLGLLFNRPVVITAYGSDINLIPQYRLPRRMIRWAANKAAAVTVVSEALKNRLIRLGVPQEKIHVIRHGVDLKMFAPEKDRSLLRSQLGISRTTLISVGHLIELKGHHIAIEAMTNLPNMDLLIAGQGQMDSTLRRQVADLGLGDRVRFLGQVDQADMPAYYGAVDALVLPSSHEGIPNVLLESMACGTPVVATRCDGIPEVITAAEAGVMMSKRTSQALVAAVLALFQTPPDRGATRRFAEQFSWGEAASKHSAVLQEIRGQGCRFRRP